MYVFWEPGSIFDSIRQQVDTPYLKTNIGMKIAYVFTNYFKKIKNVSLSRW